jgi:hypothetical protein
MSLWPHPRKRGLAGVCCDTSWLSPGRFTIVARRQSLFLFLKGRSSSLRCEDKSSAIVYPAFHSLATSFSPSRHGLHGHAKII